MGARIDLVDVARSYLRGCETVHAVRNLTLSVPSGAFSVLMGASGSGKSTLLNLIAGFERTQTGEIRIDGSSIDNSGPQAGCVGFVFQNFRLLPLLSASENVQLALLPIERDRNRREQSARTALTEVGLADRMDHRPAQLSGGQQQRVAIARAIAVRPKIILADEPTANLDSASSAQIMMLLKSVAKSASATIIVATHDPRWKEFADTLFTMSDGEVLQ